MNTGEGTVSVASLTFGISNWAVAQTVSVIPVDDNDLDGSQTYHIVMSINSVSTTDTTGYAVLTLAPVSVTNAGDGELDLPRCPIGKKCCEAMGSNGCNLCISINSACPYMYAI